MRAVFDTDDMSAQLSPSSIWGVEMDPFCDAWDRSRSATFEAELSDFPLQLIGGTSQLP